MFFIFPCLTPRINKSLFADAFILCMLSSRCSDSYLGWYTLSCEIVNCNLIYIPSLHWFYLLVIQIACDLLLFSTEISIRDYRRNTKIINDRGAVGYLYTSCCYDIRKRRIFIQRKEQYKNDAIRKKRIFSPRYGL